MARLSVCLAVLVLTAHAAHPQEDTPTERARVHLKAAIAYYDEARYEDAAREMETAYGVKPLPDLQYNLAQCYERLGRYDAAAHAYEVYLSGNPAAPDRKVVLTRIGNLHERAKAQAAGTPAPPPATEKVVFKTIVVYKQAPPPPGRGVRYAAYGAGVLALAGLA
ncbi:MAG TPA: tetratricopeptide repeat protein, partial [Polyangia bacterium]|nr:tetratricopeptide repeat protein [Polyangia bacterium]